MNDECLGLFAKYWQPGRVKTRLAKDIGAERAATAYSHFVSTLLQRLGGCGEQRCLAYTPRERSSEFKALLPDGWQSQPQAEGDLGLRMKSFFEQRFAAGCQRVVLLGSDSPNVPLVYVQQAFDRLRRHDVVLGPTEDGGYWLVGAAGGVPDIFEAIPWSTPQVWSATLATIGAADLSHAVLPTWYDVDEQKDLNRLINDLQQNPGREPALDRLRDLLTQQEQAS
jgi:rSAM/selenodomain-associated transferase 1